MIDRSRTLWKAEPFTPFAIVLADGRTVHVTERREVHVASKNDMVLYSSPPVHLRIIDPPEIRDVMVMAGTPSN